MYKKACALIFVATVCSLVFVSQVNGKKVGKQKKTQLVRILDEQINRIKGYQKQLDAVANTQLPDAYNLLENRVMKPANKVMNDQIKPYKNYIGMAEKYMKPGGFDLTPILNVAQQGDVVQAVQNVGSLLDVVSETVGGLQKRFGAVADVLNPRKDQEKIYKDLKKIRKSLAEALRILERMKGFVSLLGV